MSTVEQPPVEADDAIDLADPGLYFNRELSWLEFNQRVLELSEDPDVPLLERLKFSAITSNNLDEFFMVRVAGLHDQVDAGIETPLQDGRTPRETLERDPPHRAREQRAPGPLPGARPAAGAGGEGHPHRLDRRGLRAGARPARRALPAPDLPRPDAARRRPRPAVPLHLQPLAVARRGGPRPADPHAGLRAREGADGDAPALRAAGGRPHVRPARGPDRQAPRPALPGHGDRRHGRLPRHPRRRLHRLRRGRRPAPGGRGRAAPPPLRRGRPRRGRGGHEQGHARAARARARGRRRGRVRDRRAARPQRPVGDRQGAGLPGAARPAVDAGDAAAAAGQRVRVSPT